MKWSNKKYKAHLDNGDKESVTGISNELFGLSTSCVLTHLKTGYKVAQFTNPEAGKAVGDYLAEAYAEEFAALNKAFRKSMTHDQYKSLTEAEDLNAKIKGDGHFNSQLAEFGVKPTNNNE